MPNSDPMMPVCPFCNAALPALAAPPKATKLACPRCGEMTPASRWRVDPLANSFAASPSDSPRSRSGLVALADRNRRTALIIVGIMLGMAILGLSYVLWTTKERQARHPWMPKKLEPIAYRRPLELPGLAFLPKDCKLIAGLHAAELTQDEKIGKRLLEEPRPMLFDWPLKQIARTTGLTIDDIDHVVLGAADISQFVLVVKARQKVSLEKIADARPIRSSKHEDRPVYDFALQPPFKAMLWCLDDETLVYVIRIDEPKAEHLRGLTTTKREVSDVLAGPLLQAVKDRLPPRNFAWTAGRFDQLGPLGAMVWMLGGKADPGLTKELKTFAFGIAPVDGVTLVGQFQMTDAKAAASFKGRLDQTKIEGATVSVAVTPADAAEQWLTWQVRGDAGAMRQLLVTEKGKN